MATIAEVTGKIARKYMAHYIDSSFGGVSASFERLGKDLEEFNVELNPDTETSKNILGESTFKMNGYEESASVEPYYADVTSGLFAKLQDIIDNRKYGDACKTKMLDVHLWETTSGSSTEFVAYQQDCYVVINSYGGDTSGYQIPFTVYPVGTRTKGKVTIGAGGTVTFTADE